MQDGGVVAFVDSVGWSILKDTLPSDSLGGIVASSARHQYIPHLRDEARKIGGSFLVQPAESSEEFSDFVAAFEELDASLIISCSYSRRLPGEILGLSKNGGVNLHYSLLPRWRGKHPVQWAIIKGDKQAGVSLHEMSEEIDAGAIIAQAETPISLDDTWLSVNNRLEVIAQEILAEAMGHLLSATWSSTAQREEEACWGAARSPTNGLLELTMTAREIHDNIRALVPPLGPAFLRDIAGNKVEFERYFSLAEVLQLKYRNGALGFHWEEGCIVPCDPDENELDQFVKFYVLDGRGRAIATCEVTNYRHNESAALLKRSTSLANRQTVDWVRFDQLFSDWVRTQLHLSSLTVGAVQ